MELQQVPWVIIADVLAAPELPAALRSLGTAGRPRNLRSLRPWLQKGHPAGGGSQPSKGQTEMPRSAAGRSWRDLLPPEEIPFLK